ncbi:ArnT family glycosyltransferase [Acidaminobacter hydrogenoformans]|uniref:Dolichyl-phosphate-mannose-protein mannosyltransferase n=1 Tax=Acidaminobacter hydrogenoformans DSM 2784 TaxID=1120920 RepID=A0A1G5RZ51_9FIRM|nr:hypothetical protein [Acidaminobacter hydrogenoformans]SCZ79425.1 hypothetical protein SAMN03080599_01745 [Acidaminobacter hydrogenoformans DSM 2784]
MQFLRKHWFFVMLAAYALLSLFWLTRFPFVHSDESWLSGLTRQIMTQGSFQVTEPFFDLYPRNPHAIKLLFHSLQMPWLLTLGYNIFAVRLMSLFFGVLTLVTFRKLLIRIGLSGTTSSLTALLLGTSAQFVYASHTARQEIVVLFFMLAALERLLAGRLITGAVLSAAGLWLHPNGFIAAAILFFILLVIQRKDTLIFAGIHIISLLALVGTSLALDPHFFTNYLSYGDTLEVTADAAGRLENFRDFYLKLFHRISATYYNADVRAWLTALPAAALIAALTPRQRASAIGLTALVVLNAALFIIGRFNPTSILFAFPWLIMILAGGLEALKQASERGKWAGKLTALNNSKPFGCSWHHSFLILLIALAAYGTSLEALETSRDDYEGYLSQIRSVIPADSKVLGNLNTEYAFPPGALLDFRNLEFLTENGLSLEDYLNANDIHYIILTDELAYIARNPKWNILYGDVSKWYPELEAILAVRGSKLLRFRDDTYSIRIARYIHTPEWYTTVYELR